MITVNARPRTGRTVARCTITTVIGNVSPLPRPASTIANAAIQMFGAMAAPRSPRAQGRNTQRIDVERVALFEQRAGERSCRRRGRRRSQTRAGRSPTRRCRATASRGRSRRRCQARRRASRARSRTGRRGALPIAERANALAQVTPVPAGDPLLALEERDRECGRAAAPRRGTLPRSASRRGACRSR